MKIDDYEHEDFILYVEDAPPRYYPNDQCMTTIDCPYASANERALCIRARRYEDWYRLVKKDVIQHHPPRCFLFDLPEHPINLDQKGLQYWIHKAKHYLPQETFCGFYLKDTKWRCGQHPLCQTNPHRQAVESQHFIYDQMARDSSLFVGLEKQFPGVNRETIKLLRDYGGEPDENNGSHPLPITKIAQNLNTYPKKIHRLLNKCKRINPKTFATLKAYRNRHLKEAKAYEVDKYNR